MAVSEVRLRSHSFSADNPDLKLSQQNPLSVVCAKCDRIFHSIAEATEHKHRMADFISSLDRMRQLAASAPPELNYEPGVNLGSVAQIAAPSPSQSPAVPPSPAHSYFRRAAPISRSVSTDLPLSGPAGDLALVGQIYRVPPYVPPARIDEGRGVFIFTEPDLSDPAFSPICCCFPSFVWPSS